MEKIREIQTPIGNSKVYKSDKKIRPLEVLAELSPDFVINTIKVSESVESDMKSIDGDEYSVESFKSSYAGIVKVGKELSYSLHGTLNGMPVRIGFAEEGEIFTLLSPDENIELDNLFQQSKKLGI